MKIEVLTIAAMLLSLVSCSRSQTEGFVDFTLIEDAEVHVMTKARVSDYASLPSASDFSLDLKDGYSSAIWSGKVSSWDPTTPLMAGSYMATATYGDSSDEGFSKPAFSGSKSFSIMDSGSQKVSIEVSLVNCLVLVRCSETFSSYFPDYSFSITTGSGNVIDFDVNERRAAFIDPYRFTVNGTMTNQAGVSTTFTREYSDLSEAACYTLYFDMDSVGGSSFTISFDDSTEVVDLGTIDLNQ